MCYNTSDEVFCQDPALICTFLDPRYKSLLFLKPSQREAVRAQVVSYMQSDGPPGQSSRLRSSAKRLKREHAQSDMAFLLGEYYQDGDDSDSSPTPEEELGQSLAIDDLKIARNPWPRAPGRYSLGASTPSASRGLYASALRRFEVFLVLCSSTLETLRSLVLHSLDRLSCSFCTESKESTLQKRLALFSDENPAASLGKPQSIPSVQASQHHRNRSRSPLRGRKRARNADQARDIAEFKGQMAQILKLLSRQQVPPAPAPAPPAPPPEHTPASPVVATEVGQQDVVMSEEEQDVLSLAASWDEESFLRTETQDPDLTQIPKNSTAYESHYTLLVNGYDGVQQVFTNSTSLAFRLKGFSTFIQTDKPQYKPRQGVKIRVISLYSDLKPYKAQVNIVIKVVSRGQVVAVGTETSASFLVTPTDSWSPAACMIVYYVRDDGEVVNDFLELSIGSIFKNKVVSRGQVVAVGTETSASFLVTPTDSWSPAACMIVYYVRDDGEVVNDFLELSIGSIFKNKVSLSWSKTQVKPSESVSLGVTVTEPMSLVGILVVDKSAQLLQNGNDITGDMVTEEQAGYNEGNYFNGQPPADPLSVFQANSKAEPNWVKKIMATVHDYCVSASTSATLNVIVPDSITSWFATAFVISEGLGLGLTSSPAELKVSQPFFLSLNLPYSVIRGEQFVLEVTIFNYLNQALQAMVTVNKSDAFEFNVSGNSTNTVANKRNVTVPSQDSITVLIPIKPKQLGEITIAVTATSPNASHAVNQTVLVKAEGIEQSFSQSLLLDLVGNGQQTVSKDVNFNFPADVVNGSERAYVTLVGDLLGPSISGLESLIQMPCGCGEQNMVHFAPDIYVLQYLIKTKQIKEDIKTKAISFMTQGYQRELTYQRKDGSFSAFGDWDSSGSTWLSAFVLRCFLQARQFIYIDPTVLSRTIQWIIPQQNPTGEFREPGRVIHSELQGGQNGPLSLTAYVLMALLEDETYKSYYQSAVLGAVSFLENRLAEGISNNYTLSLVTYALSLANSTVAKTALDELNRRAEKDGGLMFWTSPRVGGSSWSQPRSTDIELASYAILSHLEQKRLAEGIPIMKWLSQQRNHLGGYSSTQSYYQSAVLGAVSFLENRLAEGISNNYTLSLVTYALSLANSTVAKTALDELNRRAEKDGGLMFWTSPRVGGSSWSQPRSTDIELASYAILSHLEQKRLAEGIPIMKWLSQQRNHLGGYSSTQDTVIALQALSGFAALSSSQDVGLTVTVSGTGLTFPAIFHIDSTNLLLLQKQQIEVQQSMLINVKAVGNGLAIFQLNVFYNVKNTLSRRRRDTGNQEGFDLSIAVTDNVNDLNHVCLHICTRLLENQNMSQSGMVLMEVGLLSGFILVEDGIARNQMIKNVESGSGKVFLYLDSVSLHLECSCIFINVDLSSIYSYTQIL
ncbi:UNVERIFIED_CONTAM: hypothetical protein FKN15_021022 [Acipenser sinensis]